MRLNTWRWHLQSIPSLQSQRVVKGRGGGGRRVLIPFPSKLFFSNPSPCCLNWNPIPIFLLFLFHESQSQCGKPHFPASKKGKSQLPFYPFTTVITYISSHLIADSVPGGFGVAVYGSAFIMFVRRWAENFYRAFLVSCWITKQKKRRKMD